MTSHRFGAPTVPIVLFEANSLFSTLFMSKTSGVRWLETQHLLPRLQEIPLDVRLEARYTRFGSQCHKGSVRELACYQPQRPVLRVFQFVQVDLGDIALPCRPRVFHLALDHRMANRRQGLLSPAVAAVR